MEKSSKDINFITLQFHELLRVFDNTIFLVKRKSLKAKKYKTVVFSRIIFKREQLRCRASTFLYFLLLPFASIGYEHYRHVISVFKSMQSDNFCNSFSD